MNIPHAARTSLQTATSSAKSTSNGRLTVAIQAGNMHPLHSYLREATAFCLTHKWARKYTSTICVGEYRQPFGPETFLAIRDALVATVHDVIAKISKTKSVVEPRDIVDAMSREFGLFKKADVYFHDEGVSDTERWFGVVLELTDFLSSFLKRAGVFTPAPVGVLPCGLISKQMSMEQRERMTQLLVRATPQFGIRSPWNLVFFRDTQPYMLEGVVDLNFLLEDIVQEECMKVGLSEDVLSAVHEVVVSGVAAAAEELVKTTLQQQQRGKEDGEEEEDVEGDEAALADFLLGNSGKS